MPSLARADVNYLCSMVASFKKISVEMGIKAQTPANEQQEQGGEVQVLAQKERLQRNACQKVYLHHKKVNQWHLIMKVKCPSLWYLTVLPPLAMLGATMT